MKALPYVSPLYGATHLAKGGGTPRPMPGPTPGYDTPTPGARLPAPPSFTPSY